jgi:hypothetical protein
VALPSTLDRDATPVLVLGPAGRTRHLAGYLLVLGYRSIPVEDVADALHALAANESVRVGLLAGDHDLPDPAPLLREIRDPARPRLVWALFGMRPSAAESVALRGAGVRFLLADPFTEEELRFVMNEAHQEDGRARLRVVERVPTTLRARVVTKTGERLALVSNLAMNGAYLATPRPALRGGVVELRLPLDDGEVALRARVMWNNVPGNLRRPHAPLGMGVHFLDVPAEVSASLRKFLDQRMRAYRL